MNSSSILKSLGGILGEAGKQAGKHLGGMPCLLLYIFKTIIEAKTVLIFILYKYYTMCK